MAYQIPNSCLPAVLRVQTKLKARGLYFGKLDGKPGPVFWESLEAALAGPQPDIAPTDRLDERNERALVSLPDPFIRTEFRKFLRAVKQAAAGEGLDVAILSGYRTWEEQQKVFDAGASKARPGFSWHNYGRAIDLGVYRGKQYLDESEPKTASRFYRDKAAPIARAMGISCGLDWRNFVDEPHFQIAKTDSPTVADRTNWSKFGKLA